MANKTFDPESPEEETREVGRMALSSVKGGKIEKPMQALFIGDSGTGKTSTVCGAPNAIMIDVEAGSHQHSVDRFPHVKCWQDILDALAALYRDDHDYRYVVVDTIDAAEMLCQQAVLDMNGWQSIEQPGYGKGFTAAREEFARIFKAANALSQKKQMGVLLTAHTHIITVSNPDGSDYAKHALKMDKRIGPMALDWADIVAYTARVPIVSERKAQAFRHVMRFQPGPSYDAKSRYRMPDEIEMPENPESNWGAFWDVYEKAISKEST